MFENPFHVLYIPIGVRVTVGKGGRKKKKLLARTNRKEKYYMFNHVFQNHVKVLHLHTYEFSHLEILDVIQ